MEEFFEVVLGIGVRRPLQSPIFKVDRILVHSLQMICKDRKVVA
jgi:hypothetical protein